MVLSSKFANGFRQDKISTKNGDHYLKIVFSCSINLVSHCYIFAISKIVSLALVRPSSLRVFNYTRDNYDNVE